MMKYKLTIALGITVLTAFVFMDFGRREAPMNYSHNDYKMQKRHERRAYDISRLVEADRGPAAV